MAYCFPSTFLVPFLIEPVATIYAPYKLISFIIRAHKNIKTFDAEKFLTPFPMDLSRYADVLLNVMLGVLVFYFPGGYTHRIFLSMAISHCVIYAVDHYKVLRCIPSCYFASDDVDWWGQWMLSIPCGLILASLAFKANCIEGSYCLDGWLLIALCTSAFVLHVCLHTWTLLNVVPWLAGTQESEVLDFSYKRCARHHAISWFSANPVNCLRSKYVYEHDPPCDYCMVGKEHLLRTNPELGLYFSDSRASVEKYEGITSLADIRRESTAVFNDIQTSLKSGFGFGPAVDEQAELCDSPPTTARGDRDEPPAAQALPAAPIASRQEAVKGRPSDGTGGSSGSV